MGLIGKKGVNILLTNNRYNALYGCSYKTFVGGVDV
jgi:hypothetical protein